MSSKEKIILVVGSLGLDRLLSVKSYPSPDSKVLTTSYNEVGGGNAANTATAMAKLLDAKFVENQNIRVKLLTKVGDDVVGKQLTLELEDARVDTSSPLFKTGSPGTTTAFTTVIVSEDECTRTCLHSPGTCGALTLEDVKNIDMEKIFENVVHLHSDSRHSSVSLYLAKEAKSRGITVSVDCEKDRKTSDLDALLNICDLLFTNAQYLSSYLSRLEKEMEQKHNRSSLPKEQKIAASDGKADDTVDMYAGSMRPISFYTRWNPQSDKRVVVTQGGSGALHFQPTSIARETSLGSTDLNEIHISQDTSRILIQHNYTELLDGKKTVVRAGYKVHQSGVLPELRIVDSTGAGDAFCGGFIVALVACGGSDENTQFCMDFGSWVAGKKLEGPGARSALPNGIDVDNSLGHSLLMMRSTLSEQLTAFNAKKL